MSPIKDLQVVYDALNENVTFSAGDVITGTVSFNLTEDTEVKGLIVKAKGDANVRWTEGTGDRRRTHHAHRRYFKVKEFLIAETGTALPRGVHRFKFRLQIPQGDFPPSFKGFHGRIVYVLQAKMSRSWRWPASAHKDLKFVSRPLSHHGQVMCPQTGSVSKEIGHFSKGKAELSATISRKVCSPGDTIDVVAKIHNSSSKKVKPKVSLMQQVVYRAMGHRRTSGQCLWKFAWDSLENKEGTVSCQVKIPDDAMCTIANCDIILVTNVLKVYLDVSFSFDPEVVFPLDIVPSGCATFQPGVAPGPYPAGAAAGGPSYSVKTSPTEETQRDGSAAKSVQRGKRQTPSTHNANDTDLHSATAHLPVHVKEEPIDVDEVSIQGLMSVKQEAGVSVSVSTAVEMTHSSSPSKDVKPVIKVECPVCSVSVPQNFINKHLDVCLSSGEKKESLRRCSLPAKTSGCVPVKSSQCANAGRSLDRTRRPMTKLVYTLLSMQELKRRLKECHLSMQGPRDQLIKRHQEFVQIYNAQCDSLNPKSAEDIAKEVEANEKMRNRLQGKAKPVMVFAKNQSEKEIEEMHSNYRKKHSSDFSRLIAQVRGRMDTTRQARIKQEVTVEGEDAQKPHSADRVPESKSCSVIKVEDTESDEDPSARGIELSSSPTLSDISISSSISDIFGPEPARNSQDTDWTPVRKRTTRGDDASSSPVSGKRRRKT